MERENAKQALGMIRQQIAEIDAELQAMVEKLVAGTMAPTLARVREITLLERRAKLEKMALAVDQSIKHF